jgi:hypothetical protein
MQPFVAGLKPTSHIIDTMASFSDLANRLSGTSQGSFIIFSCVCHLMTRPGWDYGNKLLLLHCVTVEISSGRFDGVRHTPVLSVESAYRIAQPQKGMKTSLPAILAAALRGETVRYRR